MDQGIEQLNALGQRVLVGATFQVLGDIELAAGNPSRARDALLRGDSVLAEAGEQSFRSTLQGDLAQAYLALGDQEAARGAIELAEGLGAAEDVATLILTSSARAGLALAEGDIPEAERSARSAVDYAMRTDFLSHQGQARLLLGEVLRASGRRDESIVETREALSLFEAKGDQPHRARAREQLAALMAAS
jgi:tetratricopeptide (TPR) repeat protein